MTDTLTAKPRFVLVEDDHIDAEVLERGFRTINFDVDLIRFEDGLEALEQLRDRPELTSQPYIVLLDLNMPRMNGIEFLEELRKDPKLSRSVVFVLTTSRDERDLQAAFDLNVAGYCHKAAARESVLETVRFFERYCAVSHLPAG